MTKNNKNSYENALNQLEEFLKDEPIKIFNEKLINLAAKEILSLYKAEKWQCKNIQEIRDHAIKNHILESWINRLTWENKFIILAFNSKNSTVEANFNKMNKDILGEICRHYLIIEACEIIMKNFIRSTKTKKK